MAGVEYGIAETMLPDDDITDLWFQAERDYKLGLFRMTDNNNTLLHWAVLAQQVNMVEQILAAEPYFVFRFNDSGDIPLWTALLVGRWNDGPGSAGVLPDNYCQGNDQLPALTAPMTKTEDQIWREYCRTHTISWQLHQLASLDFSY